MTYLARITIPTTADTGTTFTVPFEYMLRADTVVFLTVDVSDEEATPVLQVPGVNFTWNAQGQVVFGSAPAAGGAVFITRDSDLTELRARVQQGTLRAADINTIATQLLYLIQETSDAGIELGQTALRVPGSEVVAPLPSASNRSGKFLVFGPEGQPLLSSGTGGADSALRADLADSTKGDGLVAFNWATTYLSGSSGEKLQRGPIYLTDGDYYCQTSLANNGDAINRAFDKLDSWGGGIAVLPTGRGEIFNVQTSIVIPYGCTLQGQAMGAQAYGVVARAGSGLFADMQDFLIKMPRTGGSNQAVMNLGLFGDEQSAGAIKMGGDMELEDFTDMPRLDRLWINGFMANGAAGIINNCQRGLVTDVRVSQCWDLIVLPGQCGVDYTRGNLSSNDPAGHAIRSNGGTSGGVNFSMREFYFESCQGPKPNDFSNPGQYWVEGGGTEAMCYAPNPVVDPCIFFFGANASGKIYQRSVSWGMSAPGILGDNISGIVSYVRRPVGTGSLEVGATVAHMEYTRGLRDPGTTYKFFDGGDYTTMPIILPGTYGGTGFATIGDARAAYAVGNNSTYSARAQYAHGVRIQANGIYDQNQFPYRRLDPQVINGNVTVPDYTGEVTGPATTTVWTETYQPNELNSGRAIILHIQGRRTGTTGSKKLQLKITQTGISDIVIDLTLAATTADKFSGYLRLRAMGRLHQLVTVNMQDGTSQKLDHKQLISSGDFNPIDLNKAFTASLQCVLASGSGDKMLVYDVCEEPR